MTLLEVLVASALLAVFFVGIFGYLWSTIETRQEIERKAIPWAVGPAVLARMVEDLAHVLNTPFNEDEDVFKGSSEDKDDPILDFVAAVPSRSSTEVEGEQVRAQVNEIGYRMRRSSIDSSLFALYRREDFGVDGDPSEGGRYFKLCDRVRSFKIDYFDEDPGDPNGDGAEGLESWDSRKEKKMPWALRITLVLAPNEDLVRDDEDTRPQDQTFTAYVPMRARLDAQPAQPKTGNPGQPGR
jgi:type II secretory pathway component PulJ